MLTQPEVEDLTNALSKKVMILLDTMFAHGKTHNSISRTIDGAISQIAKANDIHPLQVLAYFELSTGMLFRTWAEDLICRELHFTQYVLISQYLIDFEDWGENGWDLNDIIQAGYNTLHDDDDWMDSDVIDPKEDVPKSYKRQQVDLSWEEWAMNSGYDCYHGPYENNNAWEKLVDMVNACKAPTV